MNCFIREISHHILSTEKHDLRYQNIQVIINQDTSK